jgi:hypothetical protein
LVVQLRKGNLKVVTSFTAKLWSAGCALLLASALTAAQSASSDSAAKTPVSSPKTSQDSTAGKTTTTKGGTKKASTVSHTGSGKGKKSRKALARSRHHGQQKIDTQRTLEIQQALVREHYLTGKPSGKWDDATQKALQKYQADNGWQSKTVPDSRALIKLGLGPNHKHLLNPESAMTTAPDAPRNSPANAVTPASSDAANHSSSSNQPQ